MLNMVKSAFGGKKILVVVAILFIAQFVWADISEEIIKSVAARDIIVTTAKENEQGKLYTSFCNGTIIDSNLILTVRHGIENNKSEIYWGALNSNACEAKEDNIVKLADIDIAFFKLPEKQPLPKVNIAQDVKVGEECFVVTTISDMLNRIFLKGYVIKIDEQGKIYLLILPISAGMSGTAVYNTNGELIGVINAIILPQTIGNLVIVQVIPANNLKTMIDKMGCSKK